VTMTKLAGKYKSIKREKKVKKKKRGGWKKRKRKKKGRACGPGKI